MRMKIVSAENVEDTRISDAISNLKDDFDYITMGIEKLETIGAIDRGLEISEDVAKKFDDAIEAIAQILSE